MRPPRVKTLPKSVGKSSGIERLPNLSITGNITGMRKLYYGNDALLVRCGSWIYNVSKEPKIYYGDAY